MTSEQIFDNEEMTKLVLVYNKTQDPDIIGEIILGSDRLISIIVSKYISASVQPDDLVQEARIHVMNAIHEFDPSKDKKLYSFLSVVIRNSIIDYLRKHKPTLELEEYEEYKESLNDNEFVYEL